MQHHQCRYFKHCSNQSVPIALQNLFLFFYTQHIYCLWKFWMEATLEYEVRDITSGAGTIFLATLSLCKYFDGEAKSHYY